MQVGGGWAFPSPVCPAAPGPVCFPWLRGERGWRGPRAGAPRAVGVPWPGEAAGLTTSRKPTPNSWVCYFQPCFEAVYVSAGCVGAVWLSLWLLGFPAFMTPKLLPWKFFFLFYVCVCFLVVYGVVRALV